MILNERRKMPKISIACFGFTKKVQHRGEMVNVDIPDNVEETEALLACQFCSKGLKNNQGLSVHLKCVHQKCIHKTPERLQQNLKDSLLEKM